MTTNMKESHLAQHAAFRSFPKEPRSKSVTGQLPTRDHPRSANGINLTMNLP